MKELTYLPDANIPEIRTGKATTYYRLDTTPPQWEFNIGGLPVITQKTAFALQHFFENPDIWDFEAFKKTPLPEERSEYALFTDFVFYTPAPPLSLSDKIFKPGQLNLENIFNRRRYSPLYYHMNEYNHRSKYITLGRDIPVGPLLTFEQAKDTGQPLYVHEVTAKPFLLFNPRNRDHAIGENPNRVILEIKLCDTEKALENFMLKRRYDWTAELLYILRRRQELRIQNLENLESEDYKILDRIKESRANFTL